MATDGSELRRSTRNRRQNPRYSGSTLNESENEERFSSDNSDQDGSPAQKRRRLRQSQEEEIDGHFDDDYRDNEGSINLIRSDEEKFRGDIAQKHDSDTENAAAAALDDDAMEVDALPGRAVNLRSKQNKESSKPKNTKDSKVHGDALIDEKPPSSSATRVRGIATLHRHGAKAQKMKLMFGSGQDDMKAAMSNRDKWAAEPCLPSRYAEGISGCGGMDYSAFYTDKMRLNERRRAWNWYIENGGTKMVSQRQELRVINEEQASKYTQSPKNLMYTFHVEPMTYVNSFSLSTGQVAPISKAMSSEVIEEDNDAMESEDEVNGPKGWYIFLGDRINCMEWAPNKDDTAQYLAVSTLDNDKLISGYANTNDKGQKTGSFAFNPTEPSSAAIYIWGIYGKKYEEDSEPAFTVDEEQKPRLEVVLCTDWGPIKQFKWCPTPRPEDKGKGSAAEINLGMLAVISGNGAIRVIEVKYMKTGSPREAAAPIYLQVDTPFFESKPPHTVCSCLAWLSSKDIAAGCSNGYVAIWSLEPTAQSAFNPQQQQSPKTATRPWLYQPFHMTYISAIQPAYPSRPYLLTTTSMDGYVRLTDLRAPTTDHVLSIRTRMGVYSLAWVDAAQAFYAPDEVSLVRSFPLRQFYASLALCRVSASVTALASSPVHPFLLMASTDGAVTVANSLPRIYESRNPVWQIVWFMHEWQRPPSRTDEGEGRRKEQEMPQGTERNDVHEFYQAERGSVGDFDSDQMQIDEVTTDFQTDDHSYAVINDGTNPFGIANKAHETELAQQPVGRIVEGFKPTTVGKKHLLDDEGKKSATSSAPNLVIHEKQTAATSIAWNPNLCCGGWAAAGTAAGLIRIEDLAT